MDEYVSTARLDQGQLKLRNRRAFASAMRQMKDGEYLVTIARAHATRSLAQNALYWGVYIHVLSEYTGFTPDDMHEVLKAKFIPKRLAISDGNGEIQGEFVVGGTTTRMNKVEFGEYLGEIQRWAAEDLGVNIPDPEEQESVA